MATDLHADPVSAQVHELAEAMQATGNYLGTLRRAAARPDGPPPEAEIVERALGQWARAEHALRELRAMLSRPPAAGG